MVKKMNCEICGAPLSFDAPFGDSRHPYHVVRDGEWKTICKKCFNKK